MKSGALKVVQPGAVWDDLVSLWELALKQQNKSPMTIEGYLGAVRWQDPERAQKFTGKERTNTLNFRSWLKDTGRSLDPAEVKPADIRDHLLYLEREGRASTTRATRYLAIHAFFKFLVEEEGVLDESPCTRLKCPKISGVKQLEVVPAEVFDALLADCKADRATDRFRAVRDEAIIGVFRSTPGRLTEITDLRVQDVDVERGTLNVLGKGGSYRTMYFGTTTAMALKRYLIERDKHELADEPWLWLGREGQFKTIYRMLKARGRAVGYPQIRPHFTRKTYAVNQLRRGEDALNIKTIAGWKSDRMLERYVGESKVVLAEEAYRRIGDPADRPAAKTK